MKNLSCMLLLAFLATAVSAQIRPVGNVGAGKHKHAGIQYGTASYYANKFQGRPTANGELYDKNKMTCAHNSLPLGTWLKVTNLRNKKSVIVRVTDRLHHKNKRLVDLSRVAASKLGYLERGLTRVKVEVLDKKPLSD
jgi:rare lipoprotein A